MKLKHLDYSFEMLKSKRDFKVIDVLKLFFAIMVVYMHTSPLNKIQPHLNFLIIIGFSKIIVPSFFAFSGFFLFRKQNLSRVDFLKYLKRLYIVYFIWNLIYNILEYFFEGKSITLLQFLTSFVYTSSPLWYVDALIKSVIILYLLSAYLSWEKLTVLFFTITILLYSSLNFYITEIPFLSGLDKISATLDYSRIGCVVFVCIGALFANVDVKKYYNGKFINTIVIVLIVVLLVEAAAFKYVSILHDDIHRRPQFYFVLPFLVFFLFYRVATLEIEGNINNGLMRKYSSIIYFSHYCFRIMFSFFVVGYAAGATLDIIKFFVVLTFSLIFSVFLCKIEDTAIGKYTKYLY